MDRREFVVAAVLGATSGCLGDDGSSEEGDSSEVELTLSDNQAELPQDDLTVEATNNTDEQFTTTPTSLVLRKVTDSGSVWLHPPLEVFRQDGPAHSLKPGDSMTWNLSVSNELSFDWDSDYQVNGLGPGEYVVEFGYRRDAYVADGIEFDAPSARLEVIGEPPSLEPVGVRDVERDGGTVIARMNRGEDGEVTLRGTDADDVPTLLLEQVVRVRLLRSLLYYAVVEDADRVELRGIGNAVDRMDARLPSVDGFSGNVREFMYKGTAYELEVGE